MLSGCVSTTGPVKLKPVNLPEPPACMAPVEVPQVTTGMDARLALIKNRSALLDANGRLKCSREWYHSVRGQYSH